MVGFLKNIETRPDSERILALTRMGLEHEMQHQELLVYDIKHLLCDLYDAPKTIAPTASETVTGMAEIEGGLFALGYAGADFAWDNEKPQHTVFLQDFAIDRAPVSNGDFLEFINAGGYDDFRWWLSEGWEAVNREQWQAPLYWELQDGQWMIRDFHGLHRVEEKANEPVAHVSYFEASAYAKWAGKRLPTEAEWEKAACFDPKQQTKHQFPWGDAAPDITKANLFENQLWSVAPIGSFPQRPQRIRLPPDDRRCLGMDDIGLRSVPRLQIRIRRIQRQMVRRAEGVARRIIRHAADSHPVNLSKFLPSAGTMDDFRVPLREDFVKR